MIQRKQTIFLVLAIIALLICMVSPVMSLTPNGMGADDVVYNLWIVDGSNATMSYKVWPMFCSLLIATAVGFIAIFKYKNRKLQMKMCFLCNLMIVIWVILYVLYGMVILPKDSEMNFSLTACLPVVAAFFFMLARKGIRDDERLVRAADRIR